MKLTSSTVLSRRLRWPLHLLQSSVRPSQLPIRKALEMARSQLAATTTRQLQLLHLEHPLSAHPLVQVLQTQPLSLILKHPKQPFAHPDLVELVTSLAA